MALILAPGCSTCREYVRNGFKVGPNYHPPCTPADDQWIDAKDPRVLTTAPNRDTWWTVFHDPVLNKLIVRAYQQNPTVKVACWRIQEARASRSIAVGGLFPQQQTVTADYTRNAVSQTVQNQVHTAPFFDDWSVHAGLAWELDFWGTYRRAVEAADAQLDASIENYHNALVLLLANVATSYVGVRTADLRLKYTNQQLSSQQGILEIARQRFHSGATTELDVTHATSQVEHTKSLIPPLNILRRQAANQLCILLGMPPRDIADLLQGTQPVPSAPPEVAVGIPAELLRSARTCSRPNGRSPRKAQPLGSPLPSCIPTSRSSEPSASIPASLASCSSQSPWLAASGRPSAGTFSTTAGSSTAFACKTPRFEQLAFQYQNKVLQAYGEAENALAGFLETQQRLLALTKSAEAGKRSVELAIEQYREGLADFNRVYTATQLLAEEEDQMALAQGGVPLYLVLLYKALGGGWQVAPNQAGAASPSDTSHGESIPVPPPEPK